MKKILSVLILCVLAAGLVGCGGNSQQNPEETTISAKDKAYVETAIKEIESFWNEEYDNSISIFDTRIIHVKDNDKESFRDVFAVVEVEFYTDYYGTLSYLIYPHIYDTVIFYKDGRTEVSEQNIFKDYIINHEDTFRTDFAQVIDDVIELGSAYNSDGGEEKSLSDEERNYVQEASNIIKSYWRYKLELHEETDGTVKIVDSRLFTINTDTSSEYYEKYFSGVKAIVEFEMYCDYYGTAPYYVNPGIDETVWIMEDGTVKMAEYSVQNVLCREYNFNLGDLFLSIKGQ